MAAHPPPPSSSLVVVLHGRMGGLASLMPGAPARPLRSLDGAIPSVTSAALCATSLERHVIAPNRARFRAIDVVGHSWSPEIGATLDTLFGLRRSHHQPGILRSAFRCPNATFAPGYCYRTASHVLGIARAMALKRAEEEARGSTYDLVLLSRWDILWSSPLLDVKSLPHWHANRERRRRTVWLPRICAPLESGNAGLALRSAICGGGATPWLASQAARECSAQARACQPDMSAEARELYVMDWWLLIGHTADADEFAAGISSRFAEHGARVLARLNAKTRGAVAMGHAWFGAQLIWSMNVTLRHHGNIAVDFHLGRAWNEFDCLALRPACASRVCSASDLPALSWHSPNARWPDDNDAAANRSFPKASTLPDESSPMVGIVALMTP